jgi:hypothetical protein
MSTVTFTGSYANGAAFDEAGHADNLYSSSSGTGLHSERNGRLTVDNFDGGLAIKCSDILAGEAYRTYADSGLRGLAYVSNAISDNTDDGFVSVFQAGMRFKLPREARCIEWNWQAYYHLFRTRTEVETEATQGLDFEVELGAMVDGVMVAHSRRQLPATMFSFYMPTGGPSSSPLTFLVNNEAIAAAQYCGSHMSLNHAAGWTGFAMRVRMQKTQQPPIRFKMERKTSKWTARPHDAFNRVTLGVRNCWALVHF